MEFMELANERRSVRVYADKPVPQALIDEAIRAAQLAPSWKNSQTGRYYVAQSPESQAKIRACLPSYNQKSSANAVLIVTAYEKGVSGFNGGEPTNELGDHADAIRAAAAIPETEAVFAVIALGYRAQDPAPRPRKATEEIVTYI